jgi:hypothetical protein
MKKALAILLFLPLFLLCSCVRTGQKDSIDFISSMIKSGYDCHVEETVSDDKLKESCYINGCKLSMYSDTQGRLVNVTVTYQGKQSDGFAEIARNAVKAFCGFENEQTDEIFSIIGIHDPLPSDTKGIKRCDTEWYGFGFVSDKTGGTLAVVSYRLEPTSVPDVTLNTTVPFLSEKTSS